MTTKVCSKCKQALSINDFYSNRKTSDSKDNVCKICRKEYTSIQYAKTKANPELYFKLKLRSGISKKKCYQLNKQKELWT